MLIAPTAFILLARAQKLVDPVAWRLFYLQIKQNVISGAYPCPDKLAVRLAAYQAQVEFGNFIPAQHRPGHFGSVSHSLLSFVRARGYSRCSS